MTEPLAFDLKQGALPLIVSMPHVSTYLPPALIDRFTPAALRLADTDWHVDRLYEFLEPMDVTVIKATHSRYVIDLNRPPDGDRLYPGKVETLLCPLETFSGEALYQRGKEPDDSEIGERRRHHWQPYHDALAAEISRLRASHTRVILLDAHSISSIVPRLFEGTLPDLNFGTDDGRSAAPDLIERLVAAIGSTPFSRILNGRFKGGYITRHYGQPDDGIDALQLELGWNAYLDRSQPETYDPDRASPLIDVLKRIVAALLQAS